MKDFVVRMLRREEIRIRADSAKDAAEMAMQFPMSSWEDKFEIHVEAANDKADQGGETLKLPTIPTTKASKKHKKNRRWKWKCRCEDFCRDDDIPF